MKNRDREYKEIFIAESLEEYDQINLHIVELEQDPDNDKVLSEIFRLLHNLKANAKAMQYNSVADTAHALESIFSAIRSKELKFEENVAAVLFEGLNYLGAILKDIDNPEFKEADPEIIRELQGVMENTSEELEEKLPLKKYYTSSNSILLSELVSIPVKRLDELLNLVGELIIGRDRVLTFAKQINNPELTGITSHLYRVTNEIQENIMSARLVNIGSLFNKFPKAVRDIAVMEQKKVRLQITGQEIKIDRNILQMLTDSLLHIVRNAITHGIESKSERKEQSKLLEGRLKIEALSDKDTVCINISDDGRGINVEKVKEKAVEKGIISRERSAEMSDKESYMLLFEPGFSLSDRVTEFSGRGVGLDVVKSDIDSMGGSIKIFSKKGKGTIFTLILPTSIAVKGSLLFMVSHEYYALPLLHIDQVITVPTAAIHQIGSTLTTEARGETIPLIYLNEFFASDTQNYTISKRNIKRNLIDIIVMEYNNKKVGLIVDRLLRQQDIVIKSLKKPIEDIQLFSGVTLLGNGEVCLVLDVAAISKFFNKALTTA